MNKHHHSCRTLSTLAFCLLSFAALHAQNTSDTSIVCHWQLEGTDIGTAANIVIGDQIDIVLCYPSAGLSPTNFPKQEEFAQHNLIPIGQRMDTITTTDGTLVQRLITTVTCFDEGDYHTGGWTLQWMDGNGTMQSVQFADSLSLTVEDYPNVDTSSAEIKDIYDSKADMNEPYTFWEIFRWVLLILIIAGVVWLILYLVRKHKQQPPKTIIVPQAPAVPPKQKALQELEALRQASLWQVGRSKEYHTRLTDIVRQYLEERYHVESTEMTSDQTMEAFALCSGFSSDRAILLQQILRTADMVKFAKAEPFPYEHEKSYTNAVAFVSMEQESAAQASADNATHTSESHQQQA